MAERLSPRNVAAAILIAGWAAMLGWTAPGQLSPDSVAQLADGRSGEYNSWHPPVMAFLLGLFDRIVPGTFLFLVFMSGLLLAALLALLGLAPRSGWKAVGALAIVLTPQWLLYQSEIWKDILFANAAIAGFVALAVVAQRWPSRRPWIVFSGLALALAAMTRQNGAVLLPVAAAALGWIALRNTGRRTALGYGAGFLLLTGALAFGANALLIAKGDGGEGAQTELRYAQSYDLAGMLARDAALNLPLLRKSDPPLEHLLRGRAAARYSAAHIDSVMEDAPVADAIVNAPEGAIFAQWQSAVLHLPLLYLAMRAPVFWQVLATPDLSSCHPVFVGVEGPADAMKELGLLPRHGARDAALARYAHAFAGTPVFSHLAFALLAIALLVLFLRRRAPADVAMAGLLTGALAFALTFLIVSVACDYRYLYLLDIAALTGALYAAVTFP